MPGWYAGKVMLALIAVRTEQADEARKRYAELAPLRRLHVGCPEAVMLKLAKEFDKQRQSSAAIRMLESLVSSNSFSFVPPEQPPL